MGGGHPEDRLWGHRENNMPGKILTPKDVLLYLNVQWSCMILKSNSVSLGPTVRQQNRLMSVIVLTVTKSIKVSDIEKYQLVPAEAWSFGQIFFTIQE